MPIWLPTCWRSATCAASIRTASRALQLCRAAESRPHQPAAQHHDRARDRPARPPSTATTAWDSSSDRRRTKSRWTRRTRVGTGWVAVCNTNHYGIAGYYVLEALARDQIGWAMTNTKPITAPLWGASGCWARIRSRSHFPALEEPPIVIDMATSAVPFGKIEMAQRRGEPIPDGWAIDGDGQMTDDPQKVVEAGALLPLGVDREHSRSHKGYCLSAMVDILCGPLLAARTGDRSHPPFAVRPLEDPTREVGKGIGHLFGALKIDAFIDRRSSSGKWTNGFARSATRSRPPAHRPADSRRPGARSGKNTPHFGHSAVDADCRRPAADFRRDGGTLRISRSPGASLTFL